MRSFLQIALVGLAIGITQGYVQFRLDECGAIEPQNKLVSFNNVFLDRNHVTIPGHVRASGEVTVNRNVMGDLRLDVSMQKYFIFDYFTLPCIARVGSCAYDVCNLLDWFMYRGCPWQLVASNVPCRCPIQEGAYTLSPHPFYIPAARGPWAWIAVGDFRVTGRLTDTQTNTLVACYTVEFTVQQHQSNFWDMWS